MVEFGSAHELLNDDKEDESLALDPQLIIEHPRVYSEVAQCIEETNSQFAQVYQVKRFSILPHPLSVEGGELTPTLKLKRSFIQYKYAQAIEAMYEANLKKNTSILPKNEDAQIGLES